MADATYTLGWHVWGSDIWTSGVYYAADLMRTLRESFGEGVRSKLLVYENASPPNALAEAADQILTYPTTLRWSAQWWRERFPKRVLKHDITTDEFLRRNMVDVIVFGKAPLGSTMPTIGLIPDFQPFYFPEYFSAQDLADRKAHVARVGDTSTRLIAYAEPVRADMAKFAPQYVGKTRVVTPISSIPENIYTLDPQEVLGKYHLPAKFLYIPNQFWQHKNHWRVFEALDVLRARNIHPFVVMTGLFNDHRAPEFTGTLLRRMWELNLRDRVAILGLVPRMDVFVLMRQAMAVMNPSLFEGYGMTVAETRWLGKRALLSDIPAHRVQNPPCAVFFDPTDVNALADVMAQAWQTLEPGPDAILENEARSAYPAHKRACAQEFLDVVKEVVRK